VLGTGSLVGVAFSLYLVNHYPLLLIALSPLGRHLVLVAPIVDPFAFVLVGALRRMLFYLASFHLGRALGPLGVPWIEARAARFGRFVRWMQGLFDRASHLVVLGMAGPTVSMLAGASGMRARVFLPLAGIGLILRMLIILGIAEWLREYLEAALVWIDEYWIPGTVVTVALVAFYRWRRRAPVSMMED
jgi:membrane protein DedA with SNARE-associated domain